MAVLGIGTIIYYTDLSVWRVMHDVGKESLAAKGDLDMLIADSESLCRKSKGGVEEIGLTL